MLIILYMLLVLRVGRCTDGQIFGTKTVGVGDEVRLTCTREASGSIFWIRVVSGNFPDILGQTFRFEGAGPRITTKYEPGIFVLHITKAMLSDTGVYFCMKIQKQNFTFLEGMDLKVEDFPGPEPDITAVPPTDPVRPGDSVTPQCSVLSDSENETCPGQQRVCCFESGSHQSHPSFNYTQGNGVEEYEKNPEGLSTKKCIYSFFKNVSSSGAGTYHCAVATCGEILFGNGSKPDTEAVNPWDSQRDNTILFLLCAVLAISLIVTAFLISSIKACDCCSGTATAGGQQTRHLRNLRRDEDTWVYSAVVFTMMKTGSGGARGAEAAQRQRIYGDHESDY